MATKQLRGDWKMTDKGAGVVRIEKPDRTPLTMEYEPGMDRESLVEFATTRTYEADLRDAGAVTRNGRLDTDAVTDASLKRDYLRHLAGSRAMQRHRSNLRAINARFTDESDGE